MVVGFALYSSRPVVVQYSGPAGLLRETFAANEIAVTCYKKAPESLEPLPGIRKILGDSREGRLARCGDGVTVMYEGGAYTLLPLVSSPDFVRICESKTHQTIEEKVSDLLRLCFVTRLPHLVRTRRKD